MIKKKVRPYKLLILLLCCLLFFVGTIFIAQGWQKIVICCGAIIDFVFLIVFGCLYLEIKDDRIIIKYPFVSTNSELNNNLKKIVIFIDNIRSIEHENYNFIIVTLKDGSAIRLSIKMCFKKKEIVESFKKIIL